MPIIQISKIQMRRGPSSDLPSPTLDDGEFGFTTDLGRLFIGQASPTLGQPNYNRSQFPFQNIEVLTENSPLSAIIGGDKQEGFFVSLPLTVTASYLTLQINNPTYGPQNFYVDVGGFGSNAIINYFVFDSSNHPIRVGRLSILWNTTMIVPPLCSDDAELLIGNITDLQWTATLVGAINSQHVELQYINNTSGNLTVYFCVDRPLP